MSGRGVRRLDESWSREISQLRTTAYQKFGADLLNPKALGFGPSDRLHLNIGITEESADNGAEGSTRKLLSLLRIERHRDAETLKFSLQNEARPQNFPTAVLSRAATDDQARDLGYGMLLRFIATKALVQAGYSDVFGTFKSSSRRKARLASLGYEMSSPEGSWGDFIKSDEPVTLARLDLKQKGPAAAEKLEEISRSAAHAFDAQQIESLVAEIVVFLKA